MRIAVMGVGGVGGYFGGKLARYYANRNDVEVVFIARGAHLKAIQEKGLQQITVEGTFIAKPHVATDRPAGSGIFDLILFCVKAYDLEESARMLKDSVDARTVVISLLNGVDNGERLKAALPTAQVLNGCVYISAYLDRPGVVRQIGGPCKLFFGPENGTRDTCVTIEGLLREAHIQAEYRNDIKTVVWEKFLFLSPLASITSHLDKTFGQIMEDKGSQRLLRGLLDEVGSVARAEGVDVPENIWETSLEKMASFPPDTKTSMHLDFEKGRKTEVETLTGYVVRAARRHGIATPLHDQVYASLTKRLASQKA